QVPYHVRLGKSPHHQPAHRHPWKKSRKAKPAPPRKITRSRRPAETNYILFTKQKSLGRPRRFSDLTQDDRCAHITSHCETLRNLCHVVSGIRTDLRFLTSELPTLNWRHDGYCVPDSSSTEASTVSFSRE